jgi:phosphatidylglycerophosphate synthase
MGQRQTLVTPGEAQSGAAGVQLLLLAWLGAAFGVGPFGLLAGVVYVAGLLGLLNGALRRAGKPALGPADVVTLARALLVGGVTALVVDGLLAGETAVVPLIGLAAVALALDAVDGQVARRTGTTSEVGARFDMEVDAFLILVLSAHVASIVGPWALAIGAMRYAFVAASWALPWLNGTLPVSYVAKTVAALQGVVLVVASLPELGLPAAAALIAVALAFLCWSFGRSVLLLWNGHRRVTTGSTTPPVVRIAGAPSLARA